MSASQDETTRHSDLGRAAARGTAHTLVAQVARIGLQLGSTLLLARLLSPSDFGVMAMVVAVIGIGIVLGDFGLSLAAMQAESLTRQQRTNLFWSNVGLGTVMAIIVAAGSSGLSHLYGDPRLTVIALILAPTFILHAACAQLRAEIARRLQFGRMAAAEVIAQAISISVAVTLAVTGAGYWALIMQQLSLPIALLLLLFLMTRWFPGLPRRTAGMRALYRFGLHTTAAQLVSYITTNIDSVIIGRQFGPTALGYYDRAFQIFRTPVIQLAGPLTRVVVPVLARADRAGTFATYVRTIQGGMAIGMGVPFALIIVTASPLVDVLLGDRWQPSVRPLQLLAVGGFFQMMTFVYYWAFLAKAKTSIQLKFTTIGRSLMVLLMFGGAVWGPAGVAAGGSLGLGLSWALLTAMAIKHVDLRAIDVLNSLRVPLLAIISAAAGSTVAVLAAPIDWPSIVRLLVSVGAGLVLLAIVSVIFRPLRTFFSDLVRQTRSAR